MPENILSGVLVYKGINPTYESLSSIGKILSLLSKRLRFQQQILRVIDHLFEDRRGTDWSGVCQIGPSSSELVLSVSPKPYLD